MRLVSRGQLEKMPCVMPFSFQFRCRRLRAEVERAVVTDILEECLNSAANVMSVLEIMTYMILAFLYSFDP